MDIPGRSRNTHLFSDLFVIEKTVVDVKDGGSDQIRAEPEPQRIPGRIRLCLKGRIALHIPYKPAVDIKPCRPLRKVYLLREKYKEPWKPFRFSLQKRKLLFHSCEAAANANPKINRLINEFHRKVNIPPWHPFCFIFAAMAIMHSSLKGR